METQQIFGTRGGRQATVLRLGGESAILCDNYIEELRKVHTSDELAWSVNKTGGSYTVRLGYNALRFEKQREIKWWWSKIWKVRAPEKTILHMWLELNDRVLTWELFQRRQGPGMCFLCKNIEEINTHLAIDCSFTRQVWADIPRWIDVPNIWTSATVENFLFQLFHRLNLKKLKDYSFSSSLGHLDSS